MSGTLSPPIPVVGQPNSVEDPVIKEYCEKMRDSLNAILNSENKVDPTLFSESQKIRYQFYTPKVNATEESTSSSSFTNLGSADEIQNVVVNTEQSLMFISYSARFLSTTSEAGRCAIFIGSNQLKAFDGTSQEVKSGASEVSRWIITTEFGLITNSTGAWYEPYQISPAAVQVVRVPAGTYNISLKYKATAGSVKSAFRTLHVWTLG